MGMIQIKSAVFVLFLGALLGSPAVLHANFARALEKTFVAQPGGNLKITTVGGDIVVRTADVGEIRLTARETVQTSSEREADELLEKLALTFVQTGNDLTVEAKYEKRNAGVWIKRWPPVRVGFTVTVPRKFNVNLITSGGDISVAGLTGSAEVRTSGGDLKFDRIDGAIDGQTSGGNISLREGTAKAKLTTSGGNIHVDRAGGATEVSTSGGDIVLDSVPQLISATTSGGDVKATLAAPVQRDALLSTSGGDVKVLVPKSAAFEVDASTTSGEVHASGLTLAMGEGAGRSRLTGAVNGGGPKLTFRSSGGDIAIRAN